MIVNALLALGRFVDRMCDRRAVDGRWSWPPLEVNAEAPRIHAVRAGARLSREEAHDLAAHDAEMRAAAHGWQPDVAAALDAMGPLVERPSALATALEVAELTRAGMSHKWCAVHHGMTAPMGGVDVVTHAGPAAACTWCCASCLAQCVVVGHLVPRQGTEARRHLDESGLRYQQEQARRFDERMVE